MGIYSLIHHGAQRLGAGLLGSPRCSVLFDFNGSATGPFLPAEGCRTCPSRIWSMRTFAGWSARRQTAPTTRTAFGARATGLAAGSTSLPRRPCCSGCWTSILLNRARRSLHSSPWNWAALSANSTTCVGCWRAARESTATRLGTGRHSTFTCQTAKATSFHCTWCLRCRSRKQKPFVNAVLQ